MSQERIIEKLQKLISHPKPDGTTALAVVNRQESAIAEWMKKETESGGVGKTSRSIGGSTFNAEGHRRGQTHGRNVSLESRARLGGGQ